MQHAILRSRPSKVWWFRVCWDKKVKYACRESNGSLKPVPVGMTREMLYCNHCKAEKCLFAADYGETPARKDGRKSAPARARAQGLAGNGKPLTPNCWNCSHLRCKFAGYVCRFEPKAEPMTKRTMIARKVAALGCNRFGLRRQMEIPPLNRDGAD